MIDAQASSVGCNKYTRNSAAPVVATVGCRVGQTQHTGPISRNFVNFDVDRNFPLFVKCEIRLYNVTPSKAITTLFTIVSGRAQINTTFVDALCSQTLKTYWMCT